MKIKFKEFDPHNVQKNTLYKIAENNSVVVREHHEVGDDILHLSYHLENNQYGIFAYEYRRPEVEKEGCKAADVLACVVDEGDKKICSLIMDLKSNIMCFDDDVTKGNMAIVAITNVSNFIQQLHDEKLHKDSFLLYLKDEEYEETEYFGIVTRKFEPEKFSKVSEYVENIMQDDSKNVPDLIKYKTKNSLAPYYSELPKIRDFSNKKVYMCGKYYDLHIVLLKEKAENYSAMLTIPDDLP